MEKLGQGGMGVVYKAIDLKLERPVALKFLPNEIASNQEAITRFKIEAKAAAALNHPNIATIYQIEEAEDNIFIVMEFINGLELSQIISSRETLPVEHVIKYAVQIAGGLRAAHDSGIIHRDIKSANIMLTEGDQIKIMDFGLAKFSDHSHITKDGSTLGTIAYMSPEQANGFMADQRSDIWSFGVVLYEMMAGHLPFSADYEQAVIYSILNEEPKNIEREIPQILTKMIFKSLTKDPDQRYQKMDEILADFNSIDGGYHIDYSAPGNENHLVGRETELNILEESMRSAYSGKGILVGVSGEAGIGKTTVVEQFLNDIILTKKPCLIAHGHCSERLSGTEAYLPFLEILTSMLQKETDVPVAKLLREHAPWWYVQVASIFPDDPTIKNLLADVKNTSQERAKRELVMFFQEVSKLKSIVLFIEDIHWADASSIDILAHIAPKFNTLRMLIVMTYRPADMQVCNHSFLQIKPDLSSRGQFTEIKLPFLPQEEIKHYMSLEYQNNRFPDSFVKLIYDKTEGSPLFMVELLRDLKARQIIINQDDYWLLNASIADIKLDFPDSVIGLIERKIKQLDEQDLQLLIAASVQGFEFDSEVVSKMLAMENETVEEVLFKIEKDKRFIQFIEESEFPNYALSLRYRFIHVLYQNELYKLLPPAKRTRLSRKAAETLEVLYGDKSEKIALSLATLYEKAGDFEKAIQNYLKASHQSLRIFAYRETTLLAEKGLKILHRIAEIDNKVKYEIIFNAIIAGSVLAIKGYAADEVEKAYLRAYELSKKVGINELDLDIITGIEVYLNCTCQLEKSIQFMQNVNEVSLSSVGLGIAYQLLGDFDTAGKHLNKGVEFKQKTETVEGAVTEWMPLIYGLDHISHNLWIEGYPDKALEANQEAISFAMKSENPFNLVHCYAFAGMLYQFRGESEKVLEISKNKLEVSEKNGFMLNMVWANLHIGWAIADQGSHLEGLKMLEDSLNVWSGVGMAVYAPYYMALIGEIYGHLGEYQKGIEYLDQALKIIETNNHRMWESDLYRIKGELLFEQDSTHSNLEDYFLKAVEISQKNNSKSLELRATISLSRFWQTQGRNKEAKVMLSKIYSWFTEGFETRDLTHAKKLISEL